MIKNMASSIPSTIKGSQLRFQKNLSYDEFGISVSMYCSDEELADTCFMLKDLASNTLNTILFSEFPWKIAMDVNKRWRSRGKRRFISYEEIDSLKDYDTLCDLRRYYCDTFTKTTTKNFSNSSVNIDAESNRFNSALTRKEKYQLFLELDASPAVVAGIREAQFRRLRKRRLKRDCLRRQESYIRDFDRRRHRDSVRSYRPDLDDDLDEVSASAMDFSFKRLTVGDAPRAGRRCHPKKRVLITEARQEPIFVSKNLVTESYLEELSQKILGESDLTSLLVFGNVSSKEVINIVTNTMVYVYQLCRSRTFPDYLASTYFYANALLGTTASDVIDKMVNVIEDVPTGWLDTLPKVSGIPNFVSEADTEEDFEMDSISWFQNLVGKTIHSEIGEHIQKVILAIVSMRILDADYSTKIIRVIGKPTKMNLTEVVNTVLEALKVMVRYFKAWIMGENFSELLLQKDPVYIATKKGQYLIDHKDHTYSGLPVEGCIDQVVYAIELKDVLNALISIQKTLLHQDPRLEMVKKMVLSLTDINVNIDKGIRGDRPTPCGVVVHGPPGIGKGRILPHICGLWGRVKRRPYVPTQMYTRCKVSDYFEKYHPRSHPYMHYSELGNMSLARAKMTGDDVLLELNSMIDSLEFPCNTAFGDKGEVFARPEIVLVDTNNPDMHASHLYCVPSAIYRRFLYYGVVVLPEFRKPNSTELDSRRSLAAGGNILDRFRITITVRDACGPRWIERTLYEGGIEGADDFLLTYFADFITHQGFVEDFFHPIEGQDDRMLHAVAVPELVLEDEKALVTESRDDAIDLPPKIFKNTSWWLIFSLQLFASLVFDLCMMICNRLGIRLGLWILVLFLLFFYLTDLLWLVVILLVLFTFIDVSESVRVGSATLVLTKRSVKDQFFYIYHRYTRKGMSVCTDVISNPFECSDWSSKEKLFKIIAAGIVSGAFLYATFGRSSSKKKLITEGLTSSFLSPDDSVDKYLLDLEEMCEIQPSRRRKKGKQDAVWPEIQVVSRTRPLHTGGCSELYMAIRGNIRQVRIFRSGGNRMTTNILGICSNFALINRHVFKGEEQVTLEIGYAGSHKSLLSAYPMLLRLKDCYDVADDVVIFGIQNLTFKNILQHFTDQEWVGTFSACVGDLKTRTNRVTDVVELGDPVLGKIPVYESWYYTYPGHGPGLCGFPLVVQSQVGSFVAAIHAGGDTLSESAFGVALYKSKLEKGISFLQENTFQMPLFSSEVMVDYDIEDPISKSPFMHENFYWLNYFGKITGNTILGGHSKLVKNPMYRRLHDVLDSELGWSKSKDFGKPMMTPKTREGHYISPYNIALRKMDKTNTRPFDQDVLDKIALEFVDRIVRGLGDSGVFELSPISLQQAVNGVEEDDFINRINASTSAAFGLPGKKSKYLPLEHDVSTVRIMTPDLKEKIAVACGSYSRRNTVGYVYKAQLKDEPREIEKCRTGKTRLFYMSSLDNLILARMVLAPFYSLMSQYGELFGTAVGVNIYRDSEELCRRMEDFSSAQMEGDYKEFDVSNLCPIARTAATIVYRVCERLGYSKHALVLLAGVLTDSLFPYISVNNDLLMKPGLQPSGRAYTAEDNSLRGVVMLMYFWYCSEDHGGLSFWDYIKPLTFGDDLLAAIKEVCLPFYNAPAYRDFCKEHFNMDFTSATKSDIEMDFLNMSEVSFLKRTFVYSEVLGRRVGQLDRNSVYRMLEWYLPSDFISEEEQMVSTFSSALYEIFFYSSESVFCRIRQCFVSIISEHYGGSYFEKKLPTFLEIYDNVV